jgi:AcrR family transcriptional regulator
MEAALYCFVNKGYAATTIDEVRQASGASIGSIYHHFGSKEQLAGELYIEGLRTYQEGFLAALRAAPDGPAGVNAMVGYHLDWVASNPDLARFLLEEREPEVMLTTAKPLRELNRAFFMEVTSWLDAGAESGPLRPLPYDLFYATLMGPVHEYSRNWLDGRSTTPIEEAKEVLAEGAWNALKRS